MLIINLYCNKTPEPHDKHSLPGKKTLSLATNLSNIKSQILWQIQ